MDKEEDREGRFENIDGSESIDKSKVYEKLAQFSSVSSTIKEKEKKLNIDGSSKR